jgi:hypothetical protein
VPLFTIDEKLGVVSTGLDANTSEPVPVVAVTAARRLSAVGVARKVATLAPRPVTPVEIGRPVQLVRTPEAGVPSAGVTSVGELLSTTEPVPVEVVTPVPPLATASVPVKAMLPAVVMDADVLPLTSRPVEPVVSVTLVTEPPEPVAEIVIDPVPFVIAMPEPAVSVDLVRVLPVVLPISSWPSV